MGFLGLGGGKAKAEKLREGLRGLRGKQPLDVCDLKGALGEQSSASGDGDPKPCIWTCAWQAGGITFVARINESDDDRVASGFVVDRAVQVAGSAGEPFARYLER